MEFLIIIFIGLVVMLSLCILNIMFPSLDNLPVLTDKLRNIRKIKIYMKKFLIIISVILVVMSSSCVLNILFPSLNNLPTGDFIASYDSPDKTYTLNIYLFSGGATVDFSIRGELLNNENHSKKNIYWCYNQSGATVKWINDYTVEINKITLDVRKDVYDSRKDPRFKDPNFYPYDPNYNPDGPNFEPVDPSEELPLDPPPKDFNPDATFQ